MKIDEFKKILEEADKSAMHTSSCHQMLRTDPVIAILAQGEVVVPLILQHYKKNRSILWGMVLAHITDLNLIDEGYFKEKHRGKVYKLQKAWLKWGRDQELI